MVRGGRKTNEEGAAMVEFAGDEKEDMGNSQRSTDL
jgi:hypothetical protein